MLCGQCGTDNRDSATHCHHCKSPLPASLLDAQSANAKGSDANHGKPNKNSATRQETKAGLGNTILTGLGVLVGFSIGTSGYYVYSLQDDPATPIITMPEPIAKYIPPSLPGIVPTSEITPTEAEPAEIATENDGTAEPATVMLDPTAPCPSKTFSCMGGGSENTGEIIKDSSCVADKPIWTYFSADKGVSWTSAGCYATEEEAKAGLTEARKVAFLKPGRLEPKPPELADKSKTEPPKKPATEKHENHPAEQKPAGTAEAHSEAPVGQPSYTTATGTSYKAQFKGAFGLILMEERHYPTVEMKQKALELWDKKQEILEPDGTINDKYVVKQPKAGGIPGFSN